MSDLDHVVRLVERLEDKFDKRFDKVDERLDDLSKTSAVNTEQLSQNTASLIDHVRRTNLLQEDLTLTKTQLKQHEELSKARSDHIESKQEEIESSVEFMVKFPKMLYKLGKWLSGVGVIGSLLYGVFRFLSDKVS